MMLGIIFLVFGAIIAAIQVNFFRKKQQDTFGYNTGPLYWGSDLKLLDYY